MNITMLPHTTQQETKIELRDYQLEAIQAVVTAENQKRALIVLPTGCGKTEIFCNLTSRYRVPTLVVAHRKELLVQAKNRLLGYFHEDEIGLVGQGIEEWGRPVTIASIQTVHRRIERLQQMGIQVIHVDEAHHARKGNTYTKVLESLPDAFRIGYTATPTRLDGASIADVFGVPVYSKSIQEMIKKGYLCDLRGVRIRSMVSLDAISKSMGDYRINELADTVNVEKRNLLVVKGYLEHAKGKPGICFAVDVNHAHDLADTFNAYGVSAVAVDGSTPSDERDRIIQQFKQREIDLLVNCELFTEGFDAPFIESVIMARPTMSVALFTQMIGRGTRLSPGKKECLILDVVDNCSRHKLTPQTFNRVMGIADTGSSKSVSFLEYEKLREKAEKRKVREERKAAKERAILLSLAKQKELQEKYELLSEEISLFGEPYTWREPTNKPQHEQGVLLSLKVAYAVFTIEHCEGCSRNNQDILAYDVYQETARNGKKQIGHTTLLHEANRIVQGYAREVLIKCRYRQGEPATAKQLWRLRQISYPIPDEGITKGEASAIISNWYEQEKQGVA